MGFGTNFLNFGFQYFLNCLRKNQTLFKHTFQFVNGFGITQQLFRMPGGDKFLIFGIIKKKILNLKLENFENALRALRNNFGGKMLKFRFLMKNSAS